MQNQKFNLCITAIIKNEALYIEEWICYYRALGVEHFFIYDNNSDDGINDALKPYINHGLVTFIRWPLLGGQIDAYNHAMHFFGHATEWMAYVDLDEFITLKDTTSLPEFLATLTGADQVLIPWRNFGFSGHEKRPTGLVIENYTLAQDIPPENFARINSKAIVRTSVAKRVTAHFAFTTSQATVDGLNRRVPEDYFLYGPNYDRVQINHYYTKSFEEFEAKLARGQGDNGAEKLKFSFKRPGYNTVDLSAQRNLEATRKQLALMASLSASPFRYGSQLTKGGPQPRDPFGWGAQVAISNYLADNPKLSQGAPVKFDNFSRMGDNVARASDFGRVPVLGGFRRNIHVSDVLRRLGNDIVFDMAEDNDNRIATRDAMLERNGEAIRIQLAASGRGALTLATDRSAQSRCYCLGYAIRTDGALRLESSLSLADDGSETKSKSVDMPAAGFYCGILELSNRPIKAKDMEILFANSNGAEIFDLFAVAYG